MRKGSDNAIKMHEALKVSWHNLNYTVKVPTTKQEKA